VIYRIARFIKQVDELGCWGACRRRPKFELGGITEVAPARRCPALLFDRSKATAGLPRFTQRDHTPQRAALALGIDRR